MENTYQSTPTFLRLVPSVQSCFMPEHVRFAVLISTGTFAGHAYVTSKMSCALAWKKTKKF